MCPRTSFPKTWKHPAPDPRSPPGAQEALCGCRVHRATEGGRPLRWAPSMSTGAPGATRPLSLAVPPKLRRLLRQGLPALRSGSGLKSGAALQTSVSPVRAQRARPEPAGAEALLVWRREAQCPKAALPPLWLPQPLPCLAYLLLVRPKRQARGAGTLCLAAGDPRTSLAARGAHLFAASSGSASKASFMPLRLRGNESDRSCPLPEGSLHSAPA